MLGYIITGLTENNTPVRRSGNIEIEKFNKAKPLLKEIKNNNFWGSDVIYSGLYTNNLLDKEQKSIVDEMIGDDIYNVEEILIFKNTKTVKL